MEFRLMEYAVVRFTEENAPGIISTNWINHRKGTSWFPNVRSEMKKNKLLMKRATPGHSSLECPIKVLKEFACYESARKYLREVEDTSNLESLNEPTKTRKKKRKSIVISDEDSSSSEEDEHVHKKSKKRPALKFHPNFFNDSSCSTRLSQNQYKVTFSLPVPTTSRAESLETPGHSRGSDSDVSDNRTTSSNQHSSDPSYQGFSCDIEQLKTNQTNICNILAELLNVTKKLECKVDLLLANSKGSPPTYHPDQNFEDMYLISSIPLDIEGFSKLNERISESPSFKQHLTQILRMFGGKDTKTLVANILRKLITDDVGEKFSLTGKPSKNGVVKQPFEKTSVYKMILEICFTSFSDAKENAVREAVSDWLMQSKFRKSRRKKRVTSSEPDTSIIQIMKEESLCSDEE